MFLRNCWYVAAWGSEVGRALFARTICGEPVVMYRTVEGPAVALRDRCCHRNLPLSLGRIEGNDLRCGYHGLKFDAAGACVEIPGQTVIAPGARVRAFPLVEKWNLLWIWMGDPAKQDESLLPHWQYLVDPSLASVHGNDANPLPMKCHWELNNDNLLDLTHTLYVHPTTLGGHSFEHIPIRHRHYENRVRMWRFVPETHPIPLWAKYLNYSGGLVDRWMATDCELPCHCTIDVGFAPAGEVKGDGEYDRGVRLRALITATPETEESSFMFYAQCRNFGVDDAEMSRKFATDVRVIFGEDVEVMEAQQRNGATRADIDRIDINADAPSLAMRRIVRRCLAAEAD